MIKQFLLKAGRKLKRLAGSDKKKKKIGGQQPGQNAAPAEINTGSLNEEQQRKATIAARLFSSVNNARYPDSPSRT
ncbi:MAG: hypothetical protein D3916_07600, partial [Candidatus Electrothrix sp. MAN1_4]|nr:hypothetical protein [Candidatus Electrothrix sp. MAN1_4]